MQNRKTQRIFILLFIFAVLMFCFGYALVPLYNVLCQALSLNGKSSMYADAASTSTIDRSRNIRVEFIGGNNANLPWDFHPETRQIDIHPGENVKISYFAKNLSDHAITIQAVPSVTPSEAAKHLKKTECFCFSQQTLKSGESMEMPILFHLDNELPKEIQEITLSYTLFVAKKLSSRTKVGKIQ